MQRKLSGIEGKEQIGSQPKDVTAYELDPGEGKAQRDVRNGPESNHSQGCKEWP